MNSLPEEVITALQQGQTIEAIKRLRSATGMDLQQAKLAVEAWQHSQTGAPPAAPSMETTDDAGPSAAVQAALRQGNTIEAIRLLRDERGLGLQQAQAQVQQWQHHIRLAPGEQPRSSGRSLLVGLIVVAMLGLSAWVLLS